MVKVNGYTKFRGRCWKFCPYSTNYFNKWYNNSWAGPTTNPGIDQTNFTGVITSDHPYTEGTMNMKNNGGCPGFICLDDACQYFLDNGVRYFEI